LSSLFITALVVTTVAGRTQAANKTWDGEDTLNNRQTAASWDAVGGGTAPVANDSFFFGGATRRTPTNDSTAGGLEKYYHQRVSTFAGSHPQRDT